MKKIDLKKLEQKTVDGLDVQILGTNLNLYSGAQIAGIIISKTGDRYLATWTADGQFNVASRTPHNYDLVPSIEVISVAEVVENAKNNFDKLQCIAGPLDQLCQYSNNIAGTEIRCVIGWSLDDPKSFGGSIYALTGTKQIHLADPDEKDTLVNLQVIHDHLTDPKLSYKVRASIMKAALDLASENKLTTEQFETLERVIRNAKPLD